MAGDFDLSDSDYLNDNWENSGLDNFDDRKNALCPLCGDDRVPEDIDERRPCAACRAQPSRLTLEEP